MKFDFSKFSSMFQSVVAALKKFFFKPAAPTPVAAEPAKPVPVATPAPSPASGTTPGHVETNLIDVMIGRTAETDKILDSRVGQGDSQKDDHAPNLVAEGVWEEANYLPNAYYTWYVTVPEDFTVIQLKILDAPGRIMTMCRVNVTDEAGNVLVPDQMANPTIYDVSLPVKGGQKLHFNVFSDKGGPGRAQYNRG